MTLRSKKAWPAGIRLAALLIALAMLMASSRAADGPLGPQGETPKRVIAVDYHQWNGKRNKFFREVVGAGRAAEGLRADWQRDLAVVHRTCGFKYIRFHGLLHDEMEVYSEDGQGKPVYNFTHIDALYDAILRIGMKPFVELSFMPQAMASGSKTVFWWKGNITPPKDYAKWEQLIQELVKHLTARYGVDEVKQWRFEVWNEPNLDIFWSGDQAAYFKLYEASARAIKGVSRSYQVGGPSTAGHAWIAEMIRFADQKHVPLDFISTHDYGVKGIGFDADGSQRLFLDPAPSAIVGAVRSVRAQIAVSPMPDLPLHYTEWSSSYSSRDAVHDSYIEAPYILSKLKGVQGYADSMSYWTFTDIFEENGPPPSPFHGGFGLLNAQGLRKPAFYAYHFLNWLGEDELRSSDPNSWASLGGRGARVLFWNFTPPKLDESDQVFFKRDLPARDAGQVRVTITGMAAGEYKMSVYRVGYQINDVYSDYLKLGSPASLSGDQVRELAEKNDGRPVEKIQVQIVAGQPFTRDFPLRENDVYLITLDR